MSSLSQRRPRTSCATALQRIAASRPLGADTFCVGQFDHQLIRLDLDPGNVCGDEDCVLNLRGLVEVVSHDQALDLGGRDSTDRSGPFRLALEQGGVK
jgi:hypothetical protein